MSEKPALIQWLDENIEQIWAFMVKSGAWVWYTIVGIVGKWSYAQMTGKRMTILQYLGSAGAALYVGYVTSNWCLNHDPSLTSFLVPVFVLGSDKLLVAAMALNWKKILDSLISIYKSDKK